MLPMSSVILSGFRKVGSVEDGVQQHDSPFGGEANDRIPGPRTGIMPQ
jgi:hypothetical protein